MLCLGVLSLGKASGYDIGKQLEQTFSNFIDVASSGVYPALKSLHEEGLVECEPVEQEGLPNKKLYWLTESGREAFTKALMELAPRHKIRSQFILLLFFADKLSEKRLRDVIGERKAELTHWIQLTRQWLKTDHAGRHEKGQDFIARYALEVMGTEINFLEENSENLLASLGDPG
jgi:DNA-binding PadR family transcriptional regulator